MKHKPEKRGVTVLIAILIMSAGLFISGWTSISQGIRDIDLSLSIAKGQEAFFLSKGCTDETLRRIRINPSYGIGAGAIDISSPNGYCAIEVFDLGSNTRRIVSTATVGLAVRQITVLLSLSGSSVTITSWVES